ncbi:hypothetical protein [Denitromonas iodatirespirans]|uniref:Uncharacterized protein n=1 Tax=Denitromonas iodatirespirans TaxID=2795389 RepID=A0A944DFN8_DENI1|nr:hypothetical protein [Denitromonas iodatirespirans]MBT0964236.1 hypothetical protein [Denitromonas iodatirespirans]
MINRLIAGVDVVVDEAQLQGRDRFMTSPRWGVRDTTTNWATHVYSVLQEFRESTIWHIAQVANEVYGITGAYQCARMLSEHSSRWMTVEEEERFKAEFQKVQRHAQRIDSVCGSGGQKRIDDGMMFDAWKENSHHFLRLPLFRVRTDVEGESGKMPPRTGVYVVQDDPNATLQFGWTGNSDGRLGKAVTFNALGLKALAALGRPALWADDDKITAFVSNAFHRGEMTDYGMMNRAGDENDPRYAPFILTQNAYTQRPCKWYFVEMIDGEYDDEADIAEPEAVTATHRPNVPAGQPCPEAGWWFTPAKSDSRRWFEQGETMPSVGRDYGQTFWQWAPDQSKGVE